MGSPLYQRTKKALFQLLGERRYARVRIVWYVPRVVWRALTLRANRTPSYEGPETRFLYKEAGRTGVEFVDVGSYLGDFAVSLALARPGLRVVAVEASEPTCLALRDIVRALGLRSRIDVIHGAASDRNARARLKTALIEGAPSPMGASLRAGEHPGARGADYVEREVETFRLDDVLAHRSSRLVVKIDVEGEEMGVLRGLEGILDRCEVILVELWHYPEVLPARDATIAWLEKRGFSAHALTSEGAPEPLSEEADRRLRRTNPVYGNYAFMLRAPTDSRIPAAHQ